MKSLRTNCSLLPRGLVTRDLVRAVAEDVLDLRPRPRLDDATHLQVRHQCRIGLPTVTHCGQLLSSQFSLAQRTNGSCLRHGWLSPTDERSNLRLSAPNLPCV